MKKAMCVSGTREVVVEADPGQEVVEGHVDALQSDWTALEVAGLQQLRKSIADEKNNNDRRSEFGNSETRHSEKEATGSDTNNKEY